MKKTRILVLTVIIICIAVGLYRARDGFTKDNNSGDSGFTAIPSPTPFPFQELTIPYLQSKSYKSSISVGDLVSETGSYSAYRASYKSDGLTLYGLLTKPKGDMPEGGWPSIVFVHGYIPPTLYKTNERYVAYVEYLASRGFVVYKIDLRGHDQSEGSPGGAYYSSDYIVDTLSARQALKELPFVNPERIGLWGHSMAGNVLMRSIAVDTTIPAIVIWAGAVYTYQDMLTYRINDQSYRPPAQITQRNRDRQRLNDTYGQFSPDNQFWRQVAVTDYIPNLKSAVQIHHAVDDEVVNIGYSRDIMKLLDTSSVAHEMYEYPTGGHNIEGSSFVTAMDRTVEFFRANL